MFEDLEFVLTQLADETRPVRSIDLTLLSDLPRAEAKRFDAAWEGLTSARRLETVRTMVERAEANIHLNFHTILRGCLNDSDEQIRRLAIDGLWEDEKISLIGRLVTLLATDPIPDVRAAAATSLGRFVLLGVLGEISEVAARQAEMALRAAWARAQQPNEVRRRALESLAYCADPAVCDLIQVAYNDEDGQMRRSAVFAMGRSADHRWSQPVLVELDSRDPAMRYEAAVSAGELGLVAAVDQLVQLMYDADSSISEAAVMALGKIGGRSARRALEEVLRSSDERLTQAAEEALEELAFNSFGVEERLVDPPVGSRRNWIVQADDSVDDDFLDGDESETRLSRDVLQEDEDSWDEGEDATPYWLDEGEEEEDDYLDDPDAYLGPAGRSVPGRDRSGPASPPA